MRGVYYIRNRKRRGATFSRNYFLFSEFLEEKASMRHSEEKREKKYRRTLIPINFGRLEILEFLNFWMDMSGIYSHGFHHVICMMGCSDGELQLDAAGACHPRHETDSSISCKRFFPMSTMFAIVFCPAPAPPCLEHSDRPLVFSSSPPPSVKFYPHNISPTHPAKGQSREVIAPQATPVICPN